MNSMVMIIIMILGLTYLGDATSVVDNSDDVLIMPANFTQNIQALMEQLAQAMTEVHNKTGPGIANFSGARPDAPYHPGPPAPSDNSTHTHNITTNTINEQELSSKLFLAYQVLQSLQSTTSENKKPTLDSTNDLSPRNENAATTPTDANDSAVAIDVEAIPTTLSTVKAKPSAESKAVGTTDQSNRYALNCEYDRAYSTWCMQDQGWYCTFFGAVKRKAGYGGASGDICGFSCTCSAIANVALTVCPLTRNMGIICI